MIDSPKAGNYIVLSLNEPETNVDTVESMLDSAYNSVSCVTTALNLKLKLRSPYRPIQVEVYVW